MRLSFFIAAIEESIRYSAEQIGSSRRVGSNAWRKGLFAIEGVDAVIHLAGQGIADKRWTDKVKQQLWASRVNATEVLCRQLVQMSSPPKCFVSASGVGIYGATGDRKIDESEQAADDFLGKLAMAWEDASRGLESRGFDVRLAVCRLSWIRRKGHLRNF